MKVDKQGPVLVFSGFDIGDPNQVIAIHTGRIATDEHGLRMDIVENDDDDESVHWVVTYVKPKKKNGDEGEQVKPLGIPHKTDKEAQDTALLIVQYAEETAKGHHPGKPPVKKLPWESKKP